MQDNIRYEIILYWSQTDQAFLAEAGVAGVRRRRCDVPRGGGET